MRRGSVVVGIFLITLSAAVAHAQPTTVTVAGETWIGSGAGRTAIFRRANGTTVALSAQVEEPCGERARKAPQPRPAWVPAVYYPTVDTEGGGLVLCLQSLTVTYEITVKAPAGIAVGADLAPMLLSLATEVRPPSAIADLGITIHPSAPVYQTQQGSIAFVVDLNPVVIAMSRDKGRCGYQHAVSVASMADVDTTTVAPAGFWPTVMKKKDGQTFFYCFETGEGMATIFTDVARPGPLVDDLLVEIRRATLAVAGAPLVTDGEITLPRTGQRIAQPRTGRWKVIDGATVPMVKPPITGDALVSIAALGRDTTFTVGVSEGDCAPGPVVLDPATTARVFPAAVGTAWLDSDPYAGRWHAHACVAAGGTRATLTVAANVADLAAPAARDADQVRALLAKIALSYGLAVTDDLGPSDNGVSPSPSPSPSPPYDPGNGGGGGDGGNPDAKASGHFGFYGGVLRITPEGGDPTFGGLVGFDLRMARPRGGWAAAMDVELGYGGGETVGEIRAGGGFAMASRRHILDFLGGLSVGSTGPGAAVDAYVEASLGLFHPGQMVWLGAMKTWGADGPGQLRLEVKLGRPKRGTDMGMLLGIRYMHFDQDAETMMGNGDAMLVTLGWGLAKAN